MEREKKNIDNSNIETKSSKSNNKSLVKSPKKKNNGKRSKTPVKQKSGKKGTEQDLNTMDSVMAKSQVLTPVK